MIIKDKQTIAVFLKEDLAAAENAYFGISEEDAEMAASAFDEVMLLRITGLGSLSLMVGELKRMVEEQMAGRPFGCLTFIYCSIVTRYDHPLLGELSSLPGCEGCRQMVLDNGVFRRDMYIDMFIYYDA